MPKIELLLLKWEQFQNLVHRFFNHTSVIVLSFNYSSYFGDLKLALHENYFKRFFVLCSGGHIFISGQIFKARGNRNRVSQWIVYYVLNM